MNMAKFHQYRKAVVAWSIPVATVLYSIITDGITVQEWILVGLTALGAGGVQAVPNAPTDRQIQQVEQMREVY